MKTVERTVCGKRGEEPKWEEGDCEGGRLRVRERELRRGRGPCERNRQRETDQK